MRVDILAQRLFIHWRLLMVVGKNKLKILFGTVPFPLLSIQGVASKWVLLLNVGGVLNW